MKGTMRFCEPKNVKRLPSARDEEEQMKQRSVNATAHRLYRETGGELGWPPTEWRERDETRTHRRDRETK